MADKDLEELAKGFRAAADAAGKLTSAERKLEDASNDVAGALDKITTQALKCVRQIEEVDARLSAMARSATPLKGALAGVNDEMVELATLSKDGGKLAQAYAGGLKEAEKAANGAAKQIEAVTKANKDGAATSKLSADEVKKLGGALKSAVTSLASGADPFKVFLEQGPAVAEVFMKAAEGGVGLKGVLLGIGETIAPMLLPLAGVAAAAAALAAPFALGAAEINKANGDITKGLGLTEEELGRVTHKTVTMGDVFQATLNVIGKHVAEGPISGALKMLGAATQDVFRGLVGSAVDGVGSIVGFWVAAYDTITKNWRNLPLALGAIFVGAVNMSIRHIETMINSAVGALNFVMSAANKIPGVKLTLFKPVDIPEMKMMGGAAAEGIYAGFEKKQAEVKAGLKRAVGETWKEVSDEAVDIVRKDAVKQARRGSSRGGSVTNISNRSATSNSYSGSRADQVGDSAVRLGRSVETTGAAEDLTAYKPEDPGKLSTMPFIEKLTPGLDALIEKFEGVGKVATDMGVQLEAAFGKPGKALSTLITSGASYGAAMADIERQLAKQQITAEEADKKQTEVRLKAYGTMAGAAKGFFKENSDGYKAMQVAEIAFHTIETLNTIKSMGLRAADTTSAIAGEGSKQAAFSATAYAKTLSSLPFPLNLLAGAAVLAALVQAGAAIKGKPSGGSVPGVNDMKTRQDAQGSGSVLGDSKAKSDGLERALTHAQAYENKDLEYGNAMVRSLKSIDDQIGAVAAALARSFAAGGMLGTDGLNLGKSGSAPTLSNLGFSKSTTRTLQDQGVQFAAATLGDILAGGLSGSTYQQVLETTKKKAFGITTSNKSKVVTETGALDADFLDQVTRLIGSLGTGVSEAAKALKATGVEAALASFKVDLGKLSFKDMTGTQIQEALNAIFGKLGDDMAKAAVPAIAEFQKVGEGAFETLVRVARQYEVIDTTLTSVGMTFGAVGVASLAARERLVDLVGGLDNLTDQTAFFAEHFLTENDRLKPVQDSVEAELERLGQPADLSRQGFKDLVLKQDVSTEDGAKLYAALMALAPAFDKVATAAEAAKAAIADKKSSIQDQIDALVLSPAEQLAKSRKAEMEAVKALDASLAPLLETLWKTQDAAEAAKLATDRSNMFADLLEAQGRSEEAKALRRANALAAVKDPVQQDYQQRIWAAEDAAAKVSAARDVLTQAYQREHDALQATKDKFAELSKSLRAFSASLSGVIAGADLASRYRTTRQTFLTTASLARMGDSDAMGRLQSEGEAFTAASRDYVATSLDYLRDVGLVRAAVDEAADTADRQVSIAEKQLEALDASVQGLIEINKSVISVQQAIFALQGALAEAQNASVASVGGSGLGLTPANPAASSGNIFDGPVDLSKMNDATRQFIGMMAWTDFKSFDPAIYHESEWDIALRQDFQKRIDSGRIQAPMGFATGGSFEVGGSGPPDSKLFNLALSPGEAVNVRRADSQGDETLVNELRRLREELADLRATSVRIATSNDKMERTLTNVTEGGRAMQTQAAA